MMLEGISATDLMIWMLFGLIVSLVVHLIDRGEVKGGILTTLISGIIGSVTGGLISSTVLYRAATGFTLQDFAIAITSSVILTIILHMILREKQHIKTIRMKVG